MLICIFMAWLIYCDEIVKLQSINCQRTKTKAYYFSFNVFWAV